MEMVSQQAIKFLESLERRSFISEIDLVAKAIEATGTPVTQSLLDYHQAVAGRVIVYGVEELILGLIHPSPRFLDPNTAEAFHLAPEPIMGFEEPPNWYVTRMDAHPDYSFLIDPDGKLYFSPDNPEASSWELYLEQRTAIAMFADQYPTEFVPLDLYNDNDFLVESLFPRIARFKSVSLSDEFTEFYLSNDFVCTRHRSWSCLWYVSEAIPDLFSAVRFS